MPIVRHDDPLAFLDAARAVLARDEAEGVLFESRARALRERPASDAPAYLCIYAAADGIGAALRRSTDALILAPGDAPASRAFADDLADRDVVLPGVYGAVAACEPFIERWTRCTGTRASLRMPLRHHVLEQLSVPLRPPGHARIAGSDDVPWLVAAQISFIAEAGVPHRVDEQKDHVERAVARGALWVWEDGEVVAYAGFDAALPSAARIGPVYTTPGRRGCGYASALVAELCEALQRSGRRRLFLSTDRRNPTANALYARLGFRPAGDVALFDLSPG